MFCGFLCCDVSSQDFEAMAGADKDPPTWWNFTMANSTKTPCVMALGLSSINLDLCRFFVFMECFFYQLILCCFFVLLGCFFYQFIFTGPGFACCEAFQEINLQMLQSRINARCTHTFIDEDAIGVMKGLARRCHRRLLELRVLGRFLLRLKTLKHRTVTPVRSARAVIKKKWCWAHVWRDKSTQEKSYMILWFYDFLWIYECSCFWATEPSYIPMLPPQPTFVNVDIICLRSILGDIYIHVYIYMNFCIAWAYDANMCKHMICIYIYIHIYIYIEYKHLWIHIHLYMYKYVMYV